MAVSTNGGGGSISLAQPTVHAITITTVADVGGNTSGQYFLISSTGNDFYIWNNVSGANLDPKIPGRTGVQVLYNTGSSAAAIATAILAALQTLTLFFSSNISATNSSLIQVSGSNTGVVLNPASAGTSSWTINTVQIGTGFSAAGSASTDTFTLTTVADVSSSTNSKYFLMSTVSQNYYVWSNVGGLGLDPSVAGRVGIVVPYAANSTSATIASAIQTALNTALGVSSVSGSVVTINTSSGGVPLNNPSVGTSNFFITRIRQGTSAQKTFSGGPFSVTLFTTPATANYTYEIEIFVSPVSILIPSTSSNPSSGIEWALVGNNLKQVSTTADQTYFPPSGSSVTSGRVTSGGWRTIKCGPSTPVTISGWAWSAVETYSISYNYTGYLIT